MIKWENVKHWMENNERHCTRAFAICHGMIAEDDTTTTCVQWWDEYMYIHDDTARKCMVYKVPEWKSWAVSFYDYDETPSNRESEYFPRKLDAMNRAAELMAIEDMIFIP